MTRELVHHDTDEGRWCLWSGVTVSDGAQGCPAGCASETPND